MVQRLLDETLTSEGEDCNECEEEGCVEFIQDHLYVDKKRNIEMVLPTYVCSFCGFQSLPPESYSKVIRAISLAEGKPEKVLEIVNDSVVVYSIH